MPPKPSTPRTLGFAVWSDNVALVRELLDAGAPVDHYGSDTAADITPLMESVDELEPFYDDSRLLVTQLLLSAGADVGRRDNTGRTALHYAVGAGVMAVEVLLAAGGDVNAAADDGATPLHEAIVRGNVSAIEALCHSGWKLTTSDGDLPLPPDRHGLAEFETFAVWPVDGVHVNFFPGPHGVFFDVDLRQLVNQAAMDGLAHLMRKLGTTLRRDVELRDEGSSGAPVIRYSTATDLFTIS